MRPHPSSYSDVCPQFSTASMGPHPGREAKCNTFATSPELMHTKKHCDQLASRCLLVVVVVVVVIVVVVVVVRANP